jgi:predicted amidophosphoribosyltransferase
MRMIFNIRDSCFVPRRIYIQGLSDLVFPKKCLICEEPGSNICIYCLQSIVPASLSLKVDGVEVKAGALYSDSTAALVVLAKEENSSDARSLLVELLYIALQAAISNFDFAEYLLIPMPSSKKSNRRRGYKHSVSLTKSLLKRILRDETNDKKFYIGDLIDINRKTFDQSQLNAESRRKNLHEAFELAQSSESRKMLAPRNQGLLLVDDVMTTGTTFKEAIRALRIEGFEPSVALCACVSGKRFY